MTKGIGAQWNSKRKRGENGIEKKEYIKRMEGRSRRESVLRYRGNALFINPLFLLSYVLLGNMPFDS